MRSNLSLALVLAIACDDRPPPSPAGRDASAADAQAGDAASPDARSDAGALDAAVLPIVRIHVRTATTPFAHADMRASLTSRQTVGGLRRFALLVARDDPAPFVVFDHPDHTEVGYDPGDDTVAGTIPVGSLRAGRYRVGRVVHTHIRYQIDANLHAMGAVVRGVFDNVQVMSDGTQIDGVARSRGWYRFVFRAFGQTFPQEGAAGPTPQIPGGGGFEYGVEGGESVYYFPVDLSLDPNAPGDLDMVIEVNMDRSFRWVDQRVAGYVAGEFDVTPTSFEPVEHFGPNAFRVFMD